MNRWLVRGARQCLALSIWRMSGLKRRHLREHYERMKTFLPLSQTVRIAFTVFLSGLAACPTPARAAGGIPQPNKYAALLAKARAGTLLVIHGEVAEARPLFAPRAGPRGSSTSEIFQGSCRAAAKTSFASGRIETFRTLDSLFGPLPQDNKMAQQFPKLLVKRGNVSPRVASERRSVKVPAWIYWVARESDRDFHVILGSTAQLTSTTIFMNSEISGLPAANPSRSPFPQRRSDIRKILANHRNENGLFVKPVAIQVSGSLLWDGEHRAPNNVGPEGLRPTKAWEIHPVKLLTER